jgi:hypothetical protein
MAFLIAYAAVGCIFAVAFVTAGIQRVDPQAIGAGLGFRMIVFPGVAALWPWLLYRWLLSIPYEDEERQQ